MAYILKVAKVKGFLGYLDLEIDLKPDVNFIIGRNGTGKTTFVRLLHSAITVDESELYKIPFEIVDLAFWDPDTRTTPQLKITKLSHRQPIFRFEFRANGREKFRSFSNKVETVEGEIEKYYYRTIENELRFRHRGSSMAGELRRTFLSKINLSWLPLLRSKSAPFPQSDDDLGTARGRDPINTKISDIIVSISRYFSTLESRSARETRSFQKDYFLSLLSFSPDRAQTIIARSARSDYETQKRTMRDIFFELGLEADDFSETLENHFKRVNSAAERIAKENRIQIDDYFALADTMRLEKIVERFRRYEKSKAEIFAPKTKFTELMNQFLLRKDFDFTEANVPAIVNEMTQEDIEPYDLSSGEKQIFVMFAETLLQEQRKHIFLADEPELSLHIEWQENLVKNIRDLNENCQIIFATHSPDLVSVYQDSVIDFEVIQNVHTN